MTLTPEQLNAFSTLEAKRAAYNILSAADTSKMSMEERARHAIATDRALDQSYEAKKKWDEVIKEAVSA